MIVVYSEVEKGPTTKKRPWPPVEALGKGSLLQARQPSIVLPGATFDLERSHERVLTIKSKPPEFPKLLRKCHTRRPTGIIFDEECIAIEIKVKYQPRARFASWLPMHSCKKSSYILLFKQVLPATTFLIRRRITSNLVDNANVTKTTHPTFPHLQGE